ncbi:MAG: hypothetical protein LBQ94_08730 [Treponema sp.]|nr:hypothetical protein [Treponema sp.]
MDNAELILKHEIENVFGIQENEINEFKNLEGSNSVYSFIAKNQKYVIKKLNDSSIVNWEQAGMADPFLDIAIAALHQGFYNIDPMWCLHQYLKRIPEKQEYLRLFSFLALDSFALMAWCIYESLEDYE